MKYIKYLLTFVCFTLFFLFLTYAIFPKGYMLMHLLQKIGFEVYAETVKEGLIESRLYSVTINPFFRGKISSFFFPGRGGHKGVSFPFNMKSGRKGEYSSLTGILGGGSFGIPLVQRFFGELHFYEICFNGYSLTVSCQNGGFLKISYIPLKRIKIVFNDFSGTCAGKEEIKKISGKIFYIYSRGLFGKVMIKTSFPGFSSLSISFEGKKVLLKTPIFKRKFYLKGKIF